MAVYFIQAGDNGPIKIGHSVNPVERLRSLSTASPVALRMLAVIDGPRSLERKIQRKFRHLQMRLEWFEPHSDLVAFCTHPDLPIEHTPSETTEMVEISNYLDALAEDLGANAETRRKWRERGQISANWHARLYFAAQSRGSALRPGTFDRFVPTVGRGAAG